MRRPLAGLLLACLTASTANAAGPAYAGLGAWELSTTVVDEKPCLGNFSVEFLEDEGWTLAIQGWAECPLMGLHVPFLVYSYHREVNYWDIPLVGTPQTGFTWDHPFGWARIAPFGDGEDIVIEFADFNDFFGVYEIFNGAFDLAQDLPA